MTKAWAAPFQGGVAWGWSARRI